MPMVEEAVTKKVMTDMYNMTIIRRICLRSARKKKMEKEKKKLSHDLSKGGDNAVI